MEINKQQIEEGCIKVILCVSKADLDKGMEKKLKEYQRTMAYPGFRVGKAPLDLIKKRYSGMLAPETMNKLINDQLESIYNKKEYNYYGSPTPCEIEESEEQDKQDDVIAKTGFLLGYIPDFEFVFPEINEDFNYLIEPSDKEIEDYLDLIKKRNGEFKDTETITDDCIVTGSFEQLDENGEIIEGGHKADDAKFIMKLIKSEDIKNQLIGLSLENSLTINVKTAFEIDTEIKHLLKIEQDEVLMNADYKFTITSIEKFFDAELNEEFYKEIFPDEEINTYEDFVDKIKLLKRSNSVGETLPLYQNIVERKLLEANDVKISRAFITEFINFENQEKKPEERLSKQQIETQIENSIKYLKLMQIKKKLLNNHEIVISDKDLLELNRYNYMERFAAYGLGNTPMAQIQKFADSEYEKEGAKEHLRNQMIDITFFDLVRKHYNQTPVIVTREEFEQLYKEKYISYMIDDEDEEIYEDDNNIEDNDYEFGSYSEAIEIAQVEESEEKTDTEEPKE